MGGEGLSGGQRAETVIVFRFQKPFPPPSPKAWRSLKDVSRIDAKGLHGLSLQMNGLSCQNAVKSLTGVAFSAMAISYLHLLEHVVGDIDLAEPWFEYALDFVDKAGRTIVQQGHFSHELGAQGVLHAMVAARHGQGFVVGRAVQEGGGRIEYHLAAEGLVVSQPQLVRLCRERQLCVELQVGATRQPSRMPANGGQREALQKSRACGAERLHADLEAVVNHVCMQGVDVVEQVVELRQ